jgi:hypothetical protein
LPRALPGDDAPTRLIVALAPIPRPDFFFWNSSALLSYEPFRHLAFPLSLALAGWILFVLSCDRAAAILFGTGSLLLTALFAFVYGGDVRHHGFFFVLFLMGAWIAQSSPEGRPVRAPMRRAAIGPSVMVVLTLHLLGTPIALYYDGRYVFSSGGRAADALRQKGLSDALFVAEIDFPATSVIGHLGPHTFAYTPRTGRPFSFVRWTADRHWDPTDEQTLRFAAELGAKRDRDAVLIMNRPLIPQLVDGEAVRRIAELSDSMIEEENFFLYVVERERAGRREDGGP